MLEVELLIEPPCPWLPNGALQGDLRIRILSCRPSAEGDGAEALVELDGSVGSGDKLMSNLTQNNAVRRVSLNRLRDGRFLMLVSTYSCPCREAGLTSLHILSMRTGEDGRLLWRILLAQRQMIRKLLLELRSKGIKVEVARVRQVNSSPSLTRNQRRVLEVAYRLGFFDFPRRVTLSQLSKILGVSATTLMETIRRAERRIVEQIF